MFKKIKLFFNYILAPMPLKDDFTDYNDYWLKRGFHSPALVRAKYISKYLEPRSSILDIGCGDGSMIEFIAKKNDPKNIFGIDIAQSAVDYVRKKGFGALQIDVTSSKFPDFLQEKTYDYALVTEVLEHIVDPEKVISLLRNQIQKRVFVTVPNSGFFVHRVRLLFGKFPVVVIQCHVKEHIRFWTVKDFLYWADYYGYRVISYESCSGLNFKPLQYLERMIPSLFGQQILYQLEAK